MAACVFRLLAVFRAEGRCADSDPAGGTNDDLSARIHNRLAPGPLILLGEQLGLRTPTDNEIERVPVPRR